MKILCLNNMSKNMIKKLIVIIGLCLFVQQASADTKNSVVGVHVHYIGTLKGFETISMAKKACEGLQEQSLMLVKMGLRPSKLAVSWRLSGTAEDLEKFTQDEYFSSDGTYLAVYKNGHTVKSYIDDSSSNLGPCVVEIVPYQETLLYDFKAHTLYHFDSSNPHTPDWYKTEILSISDGIAALNILGQHGKYKVGKDKSLGKDVVAQLPCDRFSWGSSSQCTWRPSHNEVRFPKTLELMSEQHDEKTATKIIAEFVNLHEKLDVTVFRPPAGIVVKSMDDAISSDPENATSKWCAAEKKKTGVDPCANDNDE